MKAPSRLTHLCLAIALAVLSNGCMRINTHVKLNKDCSAIITERIAFSARLLDLEKTASADLKVSHMLEKAFAEERQTSLGKGTVLVSHKIENDEDGSRESISVYKIPHIDELRYSSPFLATRHYGDHSVMRCKLHPSHEWWRPNQVSVTFRLEKEPPRLPKDANRPPGPSPRDLQTYRRLQPLMRDMLKGFGLKLTFESYTALHEGRFRDAKSRTKLFDLIDFSDTNLDIHGRPFLENEEVALELLQGKFGGNVKRHTQNHANNRTIPVFRMSTRSAASFRPSRIIFDQFYKGKTLLYRVHANTRETTKRKAKFTPLKE